MQRGSIVLVDTNVIIEAHRTTTWNALADYFDLHTVEKVIEETQTGANNRREQDNIKETDLRVSLGHVHTVTEPERAAVLSSSGGVILDPGELDLLAYANTLGSGQIWLLNSPDRAAVRYCHAKNWQDRVVSLEEMAGLLRIKRDWRLNYTSAWLSEFKLNLFLGRL